MKKKILLSLALASMAAAIVTYFVPGLQAVTYGLFTLSLGTLLVYTRTCLDDEKQSRLMTGGVMILFLLALYKFFNALG